MLLKNKSLTIDDTTVFYDHADPLQFWYLPGPVRLANRPGDNEPSFSFIRYKPAAVAGGAKGGGFMTFEVNLKLSDDQERSILSQLSATARGKLKLSAVPFDDGTVQCVALNLQGSGATVAATAAAGTFNAVEKILGVSVPSLDGDDRAAFSLTLSEEGSTILQKAFQEELTPIGVIYNLKYTAMRPALNVKITADFKRVFQQLSIGLEAQVYFVKAGIDAAFEKLVQDGAIKIEVINFTGDAEQKEREKWALDFFKDSLLRDWFEPTLLPGQVAGGDGSKPAAAGTGTTKPATNTSTTGTTTGTTTKPPATGAPGSGPTGAATAANATGDTTAAVKPPTGAAPPPAPAPAAPAAAPPAAAAPAAPPAAAAPAAPAGTTPPAGTANTGATAAPATAGTSGTPGAANNGAEAPAKTTPAPDKATDPAKTATDAVKAVTDAASKATPAMVSFKLKFVKQEELKTLTFQYDEQEAIQQTYAPPGFFGMMLSNINMQKHFLEVDLDDPFFRVFSVSAEAPIDFSRIGLQSLQVALDYGNEADATDHKHADFVFDNTQKNPKKFEVFMDKKFDTTYRYNVQYHFDPQSGWEGNGLSYEIPAKTTEDRTLLLDPYNDIGFVEITVKPNKIDAGVIESTDVILRYDDGDTKKEKTLTVLPNSPEQSWKLRTKRPVDGATDGKPVFSYHLVHHLKDRTTKEIPDVITKATTVLVNDPFDNVLDLEFSPAFDPAAVKEAFIDVEYNDTKNTYNRTERITIKSPDMNIVPLRISLVDKTITTFRYRITIIGANGKIQQKAFVETDNPFIEVA